MWAIVKQKLKKLLPLSKLVKLWHSLHFITFNSIFFFLYALSQIFCRCETRHDMLFTLAIISLFRSKACPLCSCRWCCWVSAALVPLQWAECAHGTTNPTPTGGRTWAPTDLENWLKNSAEKKELTATMALIQATSTPELSQLCIINI